MDKKDFFETIPENTTYPQVHPMIHLKVEKMITKTIDIKEMMNLSNKLFDKNKDTRTPKTPESNIYRISWLV